jgi:hypothetical protein
MSDDWILARKAATLGLFVMMEFTRFGISMQELGYELAALSDPTQRVQVDDRSAADRRPEEEERSAKKELAENVEDLEGELLKMFEEKEDESIALEAELKRVRDERSGMADEARKAMEQRYEGSDEKQQQLDKFDLAAGRADQLIADRQASERQQFEDRWQQQLEEFRENADLPANDNVPFEQRREDDGIPANDNVPGGQRQEDPDLPANDNVPPKNRDDEDRDR